MSLNEGASTIQQSTVGGQYYHNGKFGLGEWAQRGRVIAQTFNNNKPWMAGDDGAGAWCAV